MKTSILSEKKNFFIFYSWSLGSTLLTRLILKFSHQNESKFRYGFDNTINAVCACGAEVETTEYFLLWCYFYRMLFFLGLELSENLEKIDPNFLNLNVKDQGNVLLCGYQINKPNIFNQNILKNVISYVKSTARFKRPLVSYKQWILSSIKSQ